LRASYYLESLSSKTQARILENLTGQEGGFTPALRQLFFYTNKHSRHARQLMQVQNMRHKQSARIKGSRGAAVSAPFCSRLNVFASVASAPAAKFAFEWSASDK